VDIGPNIGRADGAEDGTHVGVFDGLEEGFGVES
jgi:hypothetical protein